MGELRAVLEDALSTRGQLVMLAGEPGIGKTRTAQELAAYAETASLLFGLGRAQLATLQRHEMAKAISSLRQAFDFYVESGNVASAVAVAAYPSPGLPSYAAGVSDLIYRALELVPPNSHQMGRILVSYGRMLGEYQGDYSRAEEAFDRAVAIAKRESDLALEFRTLVYAFQVDLRFDFYQKCLMKCQEALGLAPQVGDLMAEVQAHLYALRSLIALGDLDQAQDHGMEAQAPAERLHNRQWLSRAFHARTMLAQLVGDWESARHFSDRSLELSPLDPAYLADRMRLEYGIGDFASGKTYWQQLDQSSRLASRAPSLTQAIVVLALAIVGPISGEDKWADLVVENARIILDSTNAAPGITVAAMASLGLLSVIRGDAISASEQYAALEPRTGTMLWWLISADRLLGLLAQTMGSMDQAMTHFEDALAFCRRAGYRPELAWSCCDYADTLLQRKQTGDREKVTSLLDEALSISTILGMRSLMERVVALQERARSQPARAPAYPDGLTHREVEVLRLIAAGKTDREIAGELLISVMTVSTHVRNLLNKTDAANRTEAAAYAARLGLA